MPLLVLLRPPPPVAVGPSADTAIASESGWASLITAVPPNEVVAQSDISITISSISEDPDLPDAAWALATGDVVDATIGFATPPGTLTPASGDLQEIRIRLRPGSI